MPAHAIMWEATAPEWEVVRSRRAVPTSDEGHGMSPSDGTDAPSAERTTEARSLAIAVLTYKRPRDIVEVVPLLVTQASSVARRFDRVEVLVIDNDPAESARGAIEDLAADSIAVPVRYLPEAVSGITAARNRALSEAREFDLLVFIDDDERPTESWLAGLVGTFDAGGAVAVVGPVVSRFEVEPEPWIEAGEFFRRRRMPTGTRVTVAATNNLLLDARVVREIGLSFDPKFGLAGGEDTMFTRTLDERGGRLVWCDEAVVWDVVPADRTTRRWVVHRAFSSGNSWSLTSIDLARGTVPRLRARATAVARGVVRALVGVARFTLGVVTRSLRHRAKGTRTIARGLGMVSGAVGYAYEEYRRST
jgi:GT2 family glycosyltransferase